MVSGKDQSPKSSLDTLTWSQRSQRMSLVRGKGSKAEKAVRRAAHQLGYRYRLHSRTLPGRPDLVFRSRKKVIFVHGCFWHIHEGCSRARFPKSPETADWWRRKLLGNVERDTLTLRELRDQGWEVFVIWECETENREQLEALIREFLR